MPQDGISRVQKDAVVEKVFRGSPQRFKGIRVYIGERCRFVELEGPTRVGGAPSYLVAASLLP